MELILKNKDEQYKKFILTKYDYYELFQDSYCPWDDISNYDYE